MSKTNKDNLPKNSQVKQGLLIAIIGIATTVLAVMLPWALNTINPELTPTAISPTLNNQPDISDIFLASDISGYSRSTSFRPTQTIYLFFNLNDTSGANNVRAVWSAVDVDGYAPGTKIYETEHKITTPGYMMQTDQAQWDIGKYKVELYLNGTLDETIEFEIVNS
jgi:hypothetical protein